MGAEAPRSDARLHLPQHLQGHRDASLKELGEGCGTRFEFECYDVGHLYTLAHFLDRGLVKPPLFVQTIFGILGGIGADPENLAHMKRIADKLFGDQLPLVDPRGRPPPDAASSRMAAIMGGNVRVGLEDSLYLGKGQLAKSNAEQVTRIRTILEALSLEIATPAEARAMLASRAATRWRSEWGGVPFFLSGRQCPRSLTFLKG